MTYDDAIECDEITIREAIAECAKHGVAVSISYSDHGLPVGIVDASTFEPIATIDADGMLNGAEILGWLGY